MVLCLPYKFYRPDLCASARQSRLRMLLPKRDWKHKWMLLFVLSLTLTHRQILTGLEDALTSPFDRIHIQGPGISIKLAQSPDTRIHSHRHRIESSAHRQSHPKLGSTASWAQDRVFSTQFSIHSLQHTVFNTQAHSPQTRIHSQLFTGSSLQHTVFNTQSSTHRQSHTKLGSSVS